MTAETVITTIAQRGNKWMNWLYQYTYRSDDILHDVQITADKKSVP